MQRRTAAVLALIALALAAGLAFYFLGAPRLQQESLRQASDAGRLKGTLTVAGDNYLGYWPILSREFSQRLRQQGYAVRWVNDEGNYSERLQKLAQNAYDIIVLPVNSYLQHGQAHRYPAVIPAAIGESRGADVIVAYQERLVGQENRPPAVNDLNQASLKVCFTPDSPSSFLLNIARVHFVLDELLSNPQWHVRTNGSREALTRFQNRECDAAILWEPDVSRALAIPGVAPVFGSDQVSGLIVDVFAVRRQLVSSDPEAVHAFFRSYFETLAYYVQHRDQMLEEVSRNSVFESPQAVARAMARITWIDLGSNCGAWFSAGTPAGASAGGAGGKMPETITQVTKVMLEVKDLASDPLEGNPYRITNSEVLGRLCTELPPEAGNIGAAAPGPVSFAPLSDDQWSRLRTIGSMRVAPIAFDQSRSTMTVEGAQAVAQVAAAIVRNYPQYRVLIKGHTAPAGDEAANLVLSQQRADLVRQQLIQVHGIEPQRLRAQGAGSQEPLERARGETERSYRNRLARVEFLLLEDVR